MTITNLLGKIKKYKLPVDLDMVQLAYDFAAEAHKNQIRFNGEPYIEHPLRTAQILVKLRMDEPTIIAGLLHDVPEDTSKTLQDIKDNFGEEVALLVEGITKLGKLKYRGVDRYLDNLRKMFLAMASDIRTIIIKFADRLHNLETLSALPPRKQQRIAQETLEIYGPIAQRLGIGVLRTALEDQAFKYAVPKDYERIKALMADRKKPLLKTLAQVKKRLTQVLAENNIEVIHSIYRPLKGKIKDYIAQPKPNHYRSLHTTVFSDQGGIVEIQIRDIKMHEEAEYGIAAHWHYKEFGSEEIPDEYLDWVKELAKWHRTKEDQVDYLKSLKLDVFQDRIFVFTPQGDIIDLPENSTAIDFAYHIHTEVGNQAVGAKVNDQMTSLDVKLKSGDILEIITDKGRKGTNYDWLKFVKTRSARGKIRQYAKPHIWQRLKRW